MRIPIPDIDQLKQALGAFVDLTYIDKGGFKVVFKGVDKSKHTEAIKAIYIPTEADGFELTDIEEQTARAQREIEALRLCTAPCIVRLGSLEPRCVTVAAGNYLVYSEELLPGRKLSSFIGNEPKPNYEFLSGLLGFLIDVLEEMTRIGHLHRDIKPDNIFVTEIPDRPYVILDMGIAFKMQGTQLTRRDTPPGTLRYMAPELLMPDYKDNMDIRCDMYSAGLTLYEAATGVHPFAPRAEEAYATIYRIMNLKPTPLEEIRKDLPSDFCGIVDRCFKKNPALRYSRIAMLKHELQETNS
ncbi:MAG: serine/threonine-protein kinase [Kiritimatiellia bacterium]